MSPAELKGSRVTSLLTIKGTETTWIDAYYVSLDFPLLAGMPIVPTCNLGAQGMALGEKVDVDHATLPHTRR